ncbi:MAG TPA: hypothetical protein VNF26_12540 [Candidatus Baltobacterales bacterium]|nr:hypothetical protein [Candidatus Baltobacterales bacterium]
MNAPAPLRLRPLEVGDLLDETFRMYRRNFVLFAGISVIVSIPSSALLGYGYSLFGNILQQSTTGVAPNFGVLASTLPALAVGVLVNIALIPLFYGAVIFAACEAAQGRPVSAGGIVSAVMRRYFPLLGYFLLIGLMAFAFCLIPLWVWIWVGWLLVVPVMFVEDVGLIQAMGRSWRLVEGRWWRTFLMVFLLFIVQYVARLALNAFIALAQYLLLIVAPSALVLGIAGATQVIIDSLVNPVLQIAIVLVYFDLRVRREGLDLFQLAQRVTSPLPSL